MSEPRRAPTTLGDHVAANLADTRYRRNRLSTRELSARLDELGWRLSPGALLRLESDDPDKRRRLDVDDLAALALALDTTPWHLLTPKTRDGVMVAPGYGPMPGDAVSRWLRADNLMARDGSTDDPHETSRDDAPPWHGQKSARRDPLLSAISFLSSAVLREVNDDTGPHTPAQRAAMLRDHLERVRVRVELMADDLEAGHS